MIFYASRTGNVRSIVERLSLPSIDIKTGEVPLGPFLLFTYTDGLGDVPAVVEQFIKEYHALCQGVIASGNTNFGEKHMFCLAADKLANQYFLPIVAKYDLRGPESLDQIVKDFYERNVTHANILKDKQ